MHSLTSRLAKRARLSGHDVPVAAGPCQVGKGAIGQVMNVCRYSQPGWWISMIVPSGSWKKIWYQPPMAQAP